MLAIRMQRTGRSGHAQFRVIVQDSRFSPTRGRVVSYLGSYNPHTKVATIDSEKAAQYLNNGAQPSDTVARLFKKEGVKLPGWVKISEPGKRSVRHPEKRRSTAPAQPKEAAPQPSEPAEEPAESPPQETETPAEPGVQTQPAEEAPAEEKSEPSAPAEEAAEPPSEADQPG
jgi:small subunit ribosomal protein S16